MYQPWRADPRMPGTTIHDGSTAGTAGVPPTLPTGVNRLSTMEVPLGNLIPQEGPRRMAVGLLPVLQALANGKARLSQERRPLPFPRSCCVICTQPRHTPGLGFSDAMGTAP